MTLHFRLRSGEHALLLDSSHVAQVAECQVAAGADVAPWQDLTLPVIDLARVLGHAAGAQHQLVLTDAAGNAVAVLLVERIEGITDIAEREFVRALPLSEQYARHFDRAWYDTAAALPRLRLRYPFGWDGAPA